MSENETTEQFVGTSVNVEGLWLCGKAFLPALAKPMVEAAREVQNAVKKSGAVSPQVSFSWENVCNDFLSALSQSVENLYQVGDALVAIAHAYDQTDSMVGEQLGDIEKRIEDLNSSDEDKNKDKDLKEKLDGFDIVDESDREKPPTSPHEFTEAPPNVEPDGKPAQAAPMGPWGQDPSASRRTESS